MFGEDGVDGGREDCFTVLWLLAMVSNIAVVKSQVVAFGVYTDMFVSKDNRLPLRYGFCELIATGLVACYRPRSFVVPWSV
jgi:hypothetical protein